MKYQISKSKILISFSSIILFFLLFPFPKFKNNFIWEAVTDSLHIPVFFTVFIFIYLTSSTLPNKLISIFSSKNINIKSSILIFTISISILIEIIQPIFQRSFSVKDIISNSLGAILAYLVITLTTEKKENFKNISLLALLLCTSSLFVGLPIREAFQVLEDRKVSMPILYNPLTRLKLIASGLHGAKIKYIEYVLSNKPALNYTQVIPSERNWSGVEIELGESDWTVNTPSFLDIELKNLNSIDITLGLRIDDDEDSSAFDSRFNKNIILTSNESKVISIPLSEIIDNVTARKFNIQAVTRILIFTLPGEPSGAFGLGAVYLR